MNRPEFSMLPEREANKWEKNSKSWIKKNKPTI